MNRQHQSEVAGTLTLELKGGVSGSCWVSLVAPGLSGAGSFSRVERKNRLSLIDFGYVMVPLRIDDNYDVTSDNQKHTSSLKNVQGRKTSNRE